MNKKYTCRLGEIRDKRERVNGVTSELSDDLRVKVLIMYTLEEISDTLAIMLDEMREKKVKSIPLDKVKKAREEMEFASYSKGYDEVFEILDKLIEESEEK